MKKIISLMLILTLILVQNTVFAQELSNDELYMGHLQEKVIKNWVLPKNLYGQSAIVSATIDKNGTLLNAEILTTSQDDSFDKSVLNAVKKSAPFEYHPENTKESTIQLYFNQNNVKANLVNKDKKICQDNNAALSTEINVNNTNNKIYNGYVELTNKTKKNTKPKKIDKVARINDYFTYKSQVNKILSYNLPKGLHFKKKYLMLKITITPDGQLKSIEKQASSGDLKYEAKVIASIKKSTFPPIPETLGSDDFVLNYTIEIPKSQQAHITNAYNNRANPELMTNISFATSLINLSSVILNLVNTVKVINYVH